MKKLRLLGIETVNNNGVFKVTYIYIDEKTGNVIRSDKMLHKGDE